MELDWAHAKDLILLGMIGIFSGFVGTQIKRLGESVEKLNVNIATLLERVDGHEHRIQRIEDKI